MRLLARICLLVTVGSLAGACGLQDSGTAEVAAQGNDSAQCPDRPRPAAPETGFGHGDYFPPYTSLDELTGASELVVLGEVTEVGRGEVSGAQPGHPGFQSLAVTLQIIETYRGEVTGDEIVYNENGWNLSPPEEPTTEADVHRAQVGDCGFHFLTRAGPGETPAFHMTSIQGKFIAEGANGLFAGYERSDALSDELASMSFTEFRDAVRAASERMEGTSAREVECRQVGPRPAHCGPLEGGGPERAARSLYEAWAADDRARAAEYASAAAVEELWTQAWEQPGYEFSVCLMVEREKVCEFTRSSGSYIQMAIEGDSESGWTVTRASHLD